MTAMSNTEDLQGTVIVVDTIEVINETAYLSLVKQGADMVLLHRGENSSIFDIQKKVETLGRRCLILEGDIEDELFKKEMMTLIKKDLKGRSTLLLQSLSG